MLLAAKLLKVVKSEGIEIIHAHNYEAPLAGYIVRCLTGTPVVFHSHNTMGDELWTYFRRTLFRRLAKPIARLLDGSIPKRADFCIALCKEVGSFLVRMGVPEDRVLILPPGIDHPAPVSESISALRERHGLGETPLVIYTGNLDNYQNIDLLLEGFARVVRALPESVLLVVSNYDPAPYAAMAKEMGLSDHVLFRKSVSFEEVWGLLAMSDVAVNTRTSWSGFPIKTLNYMAAGKAIVAFDGSAKGMEHLVNGYIVPNNEVGEFADGVVRLMKDAGLRERLGENARRTAREKHSWVSLVEEMEKVYERLLA
jgi:glycosyltransferase involved in cell wall biosynthesis